MMFHMNRRVGLIVMCAALLAAPCGLRVAAAAAEDTELAKQMEEMQDHLKKLRRSLKSPEENAASLESLAKIQQATVAAKSETPAKAAQVPEAERAKFVAGYRKDMAALLEHLCKIEVALLDNDNAKAEDLFKEIKQIEDDGHEKYSD